MSGDAGHPPTVRLRVEGVSKSYGRSLVLAEASLQVLAGEVHALLGANGAGKSTLSKIISGLVPPSAGSMWLDGRPYRPRGKRGAEGCGVQIVQQELNVVSTLSVAENLYLSCLPRRCGFVARRRLERQTQQALARVGLEEIDPWTPLGKLGIGQQQLVEIAAALDRDCRVLILDEPTAALSHAESERLFVQVRQLRERGVAVIYISHRLDEIRTVAQRATVLRDGRVVASGELRNWDRQQLVRQMVGPGWDSEGPGDCSLSSPPTVTAGTPVTAGTAVTAGQARGPAGGDPPSRPWGLSVEALCRGQRVRDVSLRVRQGECLGLAGLVGAGRTELLRAIYGADVADTGQVRLADGVPRRFRSPAQAVAAGLALVSEDRRAEGLLMSRSIRDNVRLAADGRRPLGWIHPARERAEVQRVSDQVHLVREQLEQPVEQLSGGNQQKVVLARWMLREPCVLLLDEPTRGVDVGAKRQFYELFRRWQREGRTLLIASSDLEELLELSDRIAVLAAGRLVAEFQRGAWSREAILAAAFSGQV